MYVAVTANCDYSTIQDMRIADLNGDGKAEILGTATEYRDCQHIYYPPTLDLFFCSIETDLIGIDLRRLVLWACENVA